MGEFLVFLLVFLSSRHKNMVHLAVAQKTGTKIILFGEIRFVFLLVFLSSRHKQMVHLAVAQKTGIPRWNPGKWTHGPKPAVCPPYLILSPENPSDALEALPARSSAPTFVAPRGRSSEDRASSRDVEPSVQREPNGAFALDGRNPFRTTLITWETIVCWY